VHDAQAGEVAAVEAAVAGEERVGMEQGVSTDEEVGDDAVATLVGAAVGALRFPARDAR